MNTSYDPDVEYVQGVLVERDAGDWLHAVVHGNVVHSLNQKVPYLKVAPELRSRMTETGYRLPDVCALLAAPKGRYLTEAAYLVVEVLSEGDTMTLVMEKLREYAQKGVHNILVIDPRLRLMSIYRHPVLHEVDGDRVATEEQQVWLTRSEIFAE